MSVVVEKVKKIGLFFARAEIVSFALLWMMCLVVGGTLAQRNIGLYRAQEQFFSSFIYWAGFMPLPGGYTTMAVIFIGLIANLIFSNTWRVEKAGTIITHIGALMLLVGGLLTAAFSQEGSMVIPPGQTSDFFSDHQKVEFVVIDTSPKDHDQVVAFSQNWLHAGKTLKAATMPFEVEVVKLFKNSRFNQREIPADGTEYRGFAANFELLQAPEAKESEQNQAGVLFRVKGTGPEHDGIYGIFEDMSIPQGIQFQGKQFVFEIRRARTVLPFKLHLVQFEKKFHPGTGMAKSYKSVVTLMDGDLSQRTVIQMNEPLRYKGYTFYQSSFMENPKGDTTVLAVVKNAGRTFPYTSSIVMCIGLLIHLVIQSPKLLRNRGAGL